MVSKAVLSHTTTGSSTNTQSGYLSSTGMVYTSDTKFFKTWIRRTTAKLTHVVQLSCVQYLYILLMLLAGFFEVHGFSCVLHSQCSLRQRGGNTAYDCSLVDKRVVCRLCSHIHFACACNLQKHHVFAKSALFN